MGYRGSKSDILINSMSVKEQRVDGNYCIKNVQLRCTLMGHESGYPIKIPSKQLIFNKLSYSTRVAANSIFNLNPWFVTGFYDGEGSFIISITRAVKIKIIS